MRWLRRLFEREKPDPHKHTDEDGHLFDVIQCQALERPATDMRDPWTGAITKAPSLQGTLILMRCRCGRWKTEWIPGAWTTSDFHRKAPLDLAGLVEGLTKEERG